MECKFSAYETILTCSFETVFADVSIRVQLADTVFAYVVFTTSIAPVSLSRLDRFSAYGTVVAYNICLLYVRSYEVEYYTARVALVLVWFSLADLSGATVWASNH